MKNNGQAGSVIRFTVGSGTAELLIIRSDGNGGGGGGAMQAWRESYRSIVSSVEWSASGVQLAPGVLYLV